MTKYESNPDIDAALFEPPEQRGKDYEFTAGQAAENIPFRFIDGHLYIPVVLNGVERLWILDTGASVSVVDKAFADAIGLKREGDIKGVGAGSTVDVSFATLPPFEVKGIRFDEQTVAVIDFSGIIRRLGVDIAGILGFDFLSRFVTRVDYARELVSFYDPDLFDYKGTGRRCRRSRQGGRIRGSGSARRHPRRDVAVRHRRGHGQPGWPLCPARGLRRQRGVVRMARGAGSEYQIKVVKADSLQLAGFTVYRAPRQFRLRRDRHGLHRGQDLGDSATPSSGTSSSTSITPASE